MLMQHMEKQMVRISFHLQLLLLILEYKTDILSYYSKCNIDLLRRKFDFKCLQIFRSIYKILQMKSEYYTSLAYYFLSRGLYSLNAIQIPYFGKIYRQFCSQPTLPLDKIPILCLRQNPLTLTTQVNVSI